MPKLLAYHLDLKRPMWKRDFLDRYVAQLAAWGYNAILYEPEDKFLFSRHPALAHPDALTPGETSALAEACRSQGMEVIPMVQSLGHAECVLRAPAYAHLREDPDEEEQYDPLSDDARQLIIELFEEVISAIQPTEFFHMGGDETWRLGKSRKCAEIVQRIGVGGLYLKHMTPLFEWVRKQGLRPVIWADMVLSYPELLADLPNYVALMDWDYWTTEGRPQTIRIWGCDRVTGERNPYVTWEQLKAAHSPAFDRWLSPFAVDAQTHQTGTFRAFYCSDALRSHGFDVLTASANRYSIANSGLPLHVEHIPNCFLSTRKGMDVGLGTLVTSWAVRHCHPEVLHPATFAAACATSDEAVLDFEELCSRFTTQYYGVKLPDFPTAIVKGGQPFRMGQAMWLLKARKVLHQGNDPLPSELGEIKMMHGQAVQPTEYFGRFLRAYAEARDSFSAMMDHAQHNRSNLAFWLEGVDLHILYASFMLAAAERRLKEAAPELLAQLDACRLRTGELFAQSYTPRGVKEELDTRYGFHEEYLKTLI